MRIQNDMFSCFCFVLLNIKSYACYVTGHISEVSPCDLFTMFWSVYGPADFQSETTVCMHVQGVTYQILRGLLSRDSATAIYIIVYLLG